MPWAVKQETARCHTFPDIVQNLKAESKLSKIERYTCKTPLLHPKINGGPNTIDKGYIFILFCSASRTESRGSIICQPKWSAMWQLKSSQFCIISLVCLMVAYQMFECFFPRTWPIFELKNYRFINLLWPSGFKQYDKIRQNVPSLN